MIVIQILLHIFLILWEPHYFAGGFYGGTTTEFVNMIHTITENIVTDLEKHQYIAIWHDESHLNRYFIDHQPSIILDRSYCYPENGEAKGIQNVHQDY